jgi:hypothetical protein
VGQFSGAADGGEPGDGRPGLGAAIALTFLVTALEPLQRIFGTAALTTRQWGICLLGPIALLALLELGKLADRRFGDASEPT